MLGKHGVSVRPRAPCGAGAANLELQKRRGFTYRARVLSIPAMFNIPCGDMHGRQEQEEAIQR